MVCAMIFNVNRSSKDSPILTEEDFLPSLSEAEMIERRKAKDLVRIDRTRLDFATMKNIVDQKKRKRKA